MPPPTLELNCHDDVKRPRQQTELLAHSSDPAADRASPASDGGVAAPPIGRGAARSSAWAVPNLAATEPLLRRLRELTAKANGSLIALDAAGHAEDDESALLTRYHDARRDEWAEFDADCGKYLDELAKEERLGKYTLAELEEEEQSLDRLRRWYRELRTRDLIGTPEVADASARLKDCEARFDLYAEHVYASLASPTHD